MALPRYDPSPPDDELVTIRTFKRRQDYLLARDMLDHEGVQCFSRAEQARRHPDKSPTTQAGSFSVIVRKTEVEKAIAILDAPPLPDGYVIDEWVE